MQGDIGVAKSTDKGATWEQLGIALDEDWHLSYPYVFDYNGNVRYEFHNNVPVVSIPFMDILCEFFIVVSYLSILRIMKKHKRREGMEGETLEILDN